MSFWDIAPVVTKYAASVVAAAYGVYATVTEFREEKNGKKVLSKKGRIGIVIFLISILLGLSADVVKDAKERRDDAKAREDHTVGQAAEQNRREQEEKRQAGLSQSLASQLQTTQTINKELAEARNDLHRTASTTNATLREAKRSVDPFSISDGLKVEIRLVVPIDQPSIKLFVDRVRSLYAKKYPDLEFAPFFIGSSDGWMPNPTDKSERELARFLNATKVTIGFEKKGNEKKPVKTLGLIATAPCGTEFFMVFPEPSKLDDHMLIDCNPSDITWNDLGSDIRSYVDFEGANVSVAFESPGVRFQYGIGNFAITSNKGHRIVVPFERKKPDPLFLPYFFGTVERVR